MWPKKYINANLCIDNFDVASVDVKQHGKQHQKENVKQKQ